MQIVINEPGSYIRKRGECILLKNDNEELEISVRNIDKILITTHALITTDVIELAVENNIDIIFLKSNGTPYGRVWHSKLGSISTIRKKQLLLENHHFGLVLIKEWIGNKINNQIKLLNSLAKNRRDFRKTFIKNNVSQLNEYRDKILNIPDNKTVNEVRDTIQGYEGSAGRVYFQTLGSLLPKKYRFEKRSKNPSLDPFNCVLNYCYGILYSSVEKACIVAGLDPYIGILHCDNYNKKALVYDLIENYRAIMDEMVFKIFTKNKITDDCFEVNNNEYTLNKNGKKVVIEEYNKLLERNIRHDKRNIKLGNLIQYDCHKIANRILQVKMHDNMGDI